MLHPKDREQHLLFPPTWEGQALKLYTGTALTYPFTYFMIGMISYGITTWKITLKSLEDGLDLAGIHLVEAIVTLF